MESRKFSEKQTIAAAQNVKERDYWLKKLAQPPGKTIFPYDRQPVGTKEREFEQVDFTIPNELFVFLMKVANNSDVRLHILLTAGLVLLLNKYTGSTDITVGVPIYKQDTEGEFINTVLVLRNSIDENKTMKALLLQVSRTIREAAENQNFPVEALLYRLNIPFTEAEDFPLFDAAVLLENIHESKHIQYIHKNITFSFKRLDTGLEGRLQYNRRVYDKSTVEAIIKRLQCLLSQALSQLDTAVAQVEMFPAAEKRQILEDFNRTAVDFPAGTGMHHLFDRQVERTPGSIAVSVPIDLSDIFAELASDRQNPQILQRLAGCCFRENPYLSKGEPPFDNQGTGIKIIKTPRHNCVVVNTAAAAVLGMFNGEQDLASVFSRLEGRQLDPWLYAVEAGDLMELTTNLHVQAQRFSLARFADFVPMVKTLYRTHLLRLEGVNLHPAPVSDFSAAPPRQPGPQWQESATLHELLNKHQKLANARVLLLGDTPGIPGTGLLYLASYLKRNGISVYCRFNDTARDYPTMKKDIESLLQQVQPAVAAVSMKWFLYIARVLDICEIIKNWAGNHGHSIKIVAGGNTASFYREEIIKYDFIDYVVPGDGELPLLEICRGKENKHIPNILYRENGRVIENPMDYVQDETGSSEIYLSHLDEILVSHEAALFGTFFIYTHKGCRMQCFYCGGCRSAQERTFNRTNVLTRPVEQARKDILAAKNYTLTFQFDFDAPNENLLEYCRQLFDSIDLSSHMCIYSNLAMPSAALLELINKTFKYVYCDIDVLTLSRRHRRQLASLGMVKPQPTDEEILAFFDECDRYDNVEVRVNLITGLPYFTKEDIEAGEKLLSHIMNTYSCFSELHWARLHAQPGAPILQNPGAHGMHSFAGTYEDFLKYSRMNFKPGTPYPGVEFFNYPYIYYNDDSLNSSVTRFYTRNNLKIRQHRENKNKKKNFLESESWTYGQLNEKAGQLAALLRQKGVGTGDIVGLMLDRSKEIPLGILAILKAGAGYMPIDPEYPEERINYMLTDSNARLLLTTLDLEQARNPRIPREHQVFFEEFYRSNRFNGSDGSTRTYNSDLSYRSFDSKNVAYVIYTSGTTGKPKGVLLEHENLVNYLHWFTGVTRLTSEDRSLLTSSFAFDLGYTSLYSALVSGSQLHIVPREIYLSAPGLLDYIRHYQISYIKVTPALFTILANSPGFSPAAAKSLRWVILGGEEINPADVETAHGKCSHTRFMNHYGPTEATIGCVARVIDFETFTAYKQTPTIGTPIFNMRVYIMDRALRLLPVGVPGQLTIAGKGLAKGYLNQPALTAEKFVENPYKPGEVLYCTGDRAQWQPDGTIRFLGRMDRQVKVRGYRVELAEIENQLRTHPGVKETVVLVRGGREPGTEKYICAYIVPGAAGLAAAAPLSSITGQEKIDIGRLQHHLDHSPDKIAVKTAAASLTYGSLNRCADLLAAHILEKYDDTCALSTGEKIRYKRQMLLHGWGVESQEKLKGATVFVAGAGGGASPTIMQLALAGFGTIIVCDFDEIELSNLNRQFLHDASRIGMNKAISAQMTIDRINPHVNLVPLTRELTAGNVQQLIGDADIIFDMFDGLEAKFILSAYAASRGIPHIIAAMTDINSYAAVFHTPLTPCYHCIFDRKKWEIVVRGMGDYVERYEKNPLPVAAPSLFMSAAWGVNEAIKILLGFENPAYNKFLYFNQRGTEILANTRSFQAMTHTFSEHFRQDCQQQGFDWDVGWRGNFLEELTVTPDPHCPVCAKKQENPSFALPREVKTTPAETKEKQGTVALLLNNHQDMARAALGVWKAGKTCVPLDPQQTIRELNPQLEESGARVLLTTSAHLEKAGKLRNIVNKNIPVIDTDQVHETGTLAGTRVPGIPLSPIASPTVPGSVTRGNKELIDIFTALAAGQTFDPEEKKALPGNDLSDLRGYLQCRLPEYMIPAYFVEIEEIPLTPNGKLDRKALPEPGTGTGAHYIPPRNQLEARLVEIWSQVLEIEKERLSTDANFFQLGGHSLKATLLLGRLHKEFNIKATLAEIFEKPHLNELAEYIAGQTPLAIESPHTYKSIEPVPEQDHYILSSGQKRLYVLQQLNPGSTGYNLPQFIPLSGHQQKDKLEDTFQQLIHRHESLRTSFVMVDEVPRQKIHPPADAAFEIDYYDIADIAGVEVKYNQVEVEEERSSRFEGTRGLAPLSLEPAAALISSFIRPFDLSRAPLLRVGLLALPHTPAALRSHHSPGGKVHKYILMLDMHHIISDALSHTILIRDFTALYNGEALPRLRLQYKDYAHWQRQQYEREETNLKQQETFWMKQFAGEIPVLHLPYDYARPPVQSLEGHTVPFVLDEEETAALKQMALDRGATMYIVLLTIVNIWISRLGSQEDIVLGTPVAGRRHEDLKHIIGMFVNTLALRNFPTGQKTALHFLEEVKQRTVKAFENQDYPFEELVNKIEVKRDTARNPLFDMMFSFLDLEVPPGQRTAHPRPGEKENPPGFENPAAKFDLTLYCMDRGDRLHFAAEYCTRLFAEKTMQRLIRYFKEIATSVIKYPTRALMDMEIIPADEKKQILEEFNDTVAAYPAHKTIHELFAEQAKRTPARTALIGTAPASPGTNMCLEGTRGLAPLPGLITMTYNELSEQTHRLAFLLKEKGVHADSIVGIMVERSLTMIIGIIAILKAGGAYLPIDPQYPQERISYMLTDSKTKVLLASPKTRVKVKTEVEEKCRQPQELPLEFINIETNLDAAIEPSPSTLTSTSTCRVSPANLAYVIYTSGSTGKPKGTMIQHRSLVNRLHWMQNAYPIDSRDVILQKTPYVFDVSVWELSWWSIEGAALYLLAPGREKDPAAIIAAIEKNKITTMHFVPSMLNAFLDYLENQTIDTKRLTGLRQVFASGEALDVSPVERFNRLIHERTGTRLINLYGPTEATVDVSYFDCTPSPQVDKIPIGKPIDNNRLYIVNPHLQLQPIGIPGELCIAGIGLARGYLNNPELTAERFCPRRPGGTLFEKTAPVKHLDSPRKNFSLESPDKGFYRFHRSHRSYTSYISYKSYIYRTGDLASWQPDGNIRFLGRIDHQVKVRGFRIEPGEIASCLLNHQAIHGAVVIPLPQNTGTDRSLCAYIASEQELTAMELKEYLSKELPDYMIPAYFVRIKTIPLTPNGKVDRSALPTPDGSIRTGTQYAPPTDEIEEKLSNIWQETLGNRTMGIEDDFFLLGGDSLKAITLFSKIDKAFSPHPLMLMDLFRYPTIKQLAGQIKSGREIETGILQQMTAPGQGKKISFICIPYAGGNTAAYLKLAREISDTDPGIAIYTVAIPGNEIGRPQPKDKSLKETAAKCLQEIKKSITTPVVLYGHCVGAALTLEIARLLEEENSPLQCVFIGGALFSLDLLIKDSDMWKSKSNEEIRDLMVEWGAFKKGEIPRKDLMFFIRNFRKDVKLAVDYYKNAYKQSKRKKIKTPIYNIISKQDPLTRNYRWGYRKWKKFAGSIKLIAINHGSHYFVNDNAPEVTAIVLNILSGHPSSRHVQGAKKIK